MRFIAAADSRNIGSVFIWCGVLVVLLIAGFAAYTYLKRWMNQTEETGGGGFTLSDLRELHRQGKMSDAEYEQTKALMIGSAKKIAENLPEVLPRRKSAAPGSGSPPPPLS